MRPRMRNFSALRTRMLLRAMLIALLAAGGVCEAQDNTSPPSPKTATEPKVLLKATDGFFAVWYGQYGGGPEPKLLLQVFSDRSAEKGKDKVTLTPEQFKKVETFLDDPDLLALKGDVYCGLGGTDYQTIMSITFYHHHLQQHITLNNFYPGTPWLSWPGDCPKVIVKLQCTVWRLALNTDKKPDSNQENKEKTKPEARPNCKDILPN